MTSRSPSASQFVVSSAQDLRTISHLDVDSGSALCHLSHQNLPSDFTSCKDYKDIALSRPHLTYDGCKDSSNDLIIGWNDMFDEHLLTDVSPPQPSHVHVMPSIPFQSPAPRPSISFIKDAVCLGASIESHVNNKETICSTEITKTALKNSSTQKSLQPKVDAATKKIKIPKLDPTDKRLQRKQKYTMSVKNWLADVDSTRSPKENVAVEEAVGGSARGFVTHGGENKNATKVIQSRLANKGGVMKFGTPKNVSTSRKVKKRDTERFSREQAPAQM